MPIPQSITLLLEQRSHLVVMIISSLTIDMFALCAEESIGFYCITSDGRCKLKNDLTLISNAKQNGKLRRMDCSSDGSRIVLVFGTHLDVYNFDSDQSLDSSSMSSIPLPLKDGKEIGDVIHIAISQDGKIIAFRDHWTDTIYSCRLEEEGDGEKKVHMHSMGVYVRSLRFLSRSSTLGRYPLVLSYRNYTNTLAVDSTGGFDDPSLLLRCLTCCDDETMLKLIPENNRINAAFLCEF